MIYSVISGAPVFFACACIYAFAVLAHISFYLLVKRIAFTEYITQQLKLSSLNGGILLAAQQILFVQAIKLAPIAEANIIYYIWPILIIIFYRIFFALELKTNHIVGIILGFLGIILINFNHAQFSPSYLTGYAFALSAAFAWAFFSAYIKKREMIFFGSYFFIACLICLGISLSIESLQMPTLKESIALFILGFFIIGISNSFWCLSLKTGDVHLLSTLSYSIPLISIYVLSCFGKAVLTLNLLAACFLVVVGGLLSSPAFHYFVKKYKKQNLNKPLHKSK